MFLCRSTAMSDNTGVTALTHKPSPPLGVEATLTLHGSHHRCLMRVQRNRLSYALTGTFRTWHVPALLNHHRMYRRAIACKACETIQRIYRGYLARLVAEFLRVLVRRVITTQARKTTRVCGCHSCRKPLSRKPLHTHPCLLSPKEICGDAEKSVERRFPHVICLKYVICSHHFTILAPFVFFFHGAVPVPTPRSIDTPGRLPRSTPAKEILELDDHEAPRCDLRAKVLPGCSRPKESRMPASGELRPVS